MNSRTLARLNQIERSVGGTQGASGIPEPLETLIAEDRQILRPYLEARKRAKRRYANGRLKSIERCIAIWRLASSTAVF